MLVPTNNLLVQRVSMWDSTEGTIALRCRGEYRSREGHDVYWRLQIRGKGISSASFPIFQNLFVYRQLGIESPLEYCPLRHSYLLCRTQLHLTYQQTMATNGSVQPTGKDFSQSSGSTTFDSEQAALNQIRRTASVSLSPELFEKLYLAPHTTVKGDLRRTFANPTPLYVGFWTLTVPLKN